MKFQVPEVIETYSLYASVPSPSSALLLPRCGEDTISVHSKWTTRDLQRSELTRFCRDYAGLVKNGNLVFMSSTLPQEADSECLVAFSPSGNKKAVLRQTSEKGEKVQYLEVWNSRSKVKTFPVKNLKDHGKIYDDGQFGCLSWSPNEEFLLYIAEKKQPKYESFFEKSTSYVGDTDAESSKEEVVKGEECLYREEWGEALVGKHHSVVCVLNTSNGQVKVFSVGENISPGQAIWICEKTIVCVGWLEYPRRLGITYCTNRKSDLYRISVESGETDILCQSLGAVRSPRYISDKGFLLFVDNKDGGPHHSGSRLVKFDWKSGEQQVVVDIVDNSSEGSFPGLYIDNLPMRCWSESGNYIFLSSLWRSEKKIILINILTGDVTALDIDFPVGCSTVLDVKNDVILASASSPNIEPFLLAGVFSINSEGQTSVKWFSLDGAPKVVSGVKWSIISLQPPEDNENEKYLGIKYEAIFVSPESPNGTVPLIVWPHGGPHSAFSAAFQLYATVFVKLGFAVCMVNYRGSIGFGENSIKSLLGTIGTQDVKDVQFAVESVMKRDDIKIGEIALFGGSHGGFLVTHLSGQYPDFYKVCICRNPVIDISAKGDNTDIPDWALVECGIGEKFGFGTSPGPDLLTVMWMKSPIRYIENVKVPTLILIGKNDLRVPPSQGKKYYSILRAKNVPVRMCMFEDNHALSNTGVEAEGFMQTILWLKQHLS